MILFCLRAKTFSISNFGTDFLVDILDKDLEDARNRRWEKAFGSNVGEDDVSRAYSRKATIVLEHLLQASEVAHTMQVR